MTATGAMWHNWSRTEKVRPLRVERPKTAGAVQRAVVAAAGSGIPIKAVGTGHSFSGIAVAPGVLLELDDLSGLIDVDQERRRVTLLAGTRLHAVPRLIEPHGLAMENLGDIDRQSLAGAISTGTHGTGAAFGGLSTQVVGVTLITGTGELLRISEEENAELLPAVALGLGALGIIVDVTLQCVPRFVLGAVERKEPLDDVLDGLDERASAVDHFEFFWFPHTRIAFTRSNTRMPAGARPKPLGVAKKWLNDSVIANGLFRVTSSIGTVVPALIPRINGAANVFTSDRDFSDYSPRVFATRRTVRFREMEYALPAENVSEALRAVDDLIARRRWRISFPVEVRFAASDDLWLSTASGRATGYIAVHRYYREDPTAYFRAVEEIMMAYGGRPHWGKMNYRSDESLREAYPRFDEFLAVRDRLDPARLFTNSYLKRVLGS